MTGTKRRIVICGAGIAGVAAAYHLAVVHGCEDVVLLEADNPLSLTSDKSTEAYRNWWPGPTSAMTAYMNRSIDLIESIARATGNRIGLNRRGYLFASADAGKSAFLHEMACLAARHGAGPVRVHERGSTSYEPSPATGFDLSLTGADIITDQSLIRRHYPYLAPSTKVVAQARRAGWLSAQQLGMVMLEAAREHGVRLMRGKLAGIETDGARLRKAIVVEKGERQSLEASDLVLSAGPMLKDVAGAIGLDLPVFAERHYKISIPDTLGVVARDAPMMIWLDSQFLPWSEEEHATLSAAPETRWLTEPFPAGVHGRPDGVGAATTLVMLFNYENVATDVVFPLPEHEHYGEITLRGMSTMLPGLKPYIERGTRPYVDGGYYMKTRENMPLIGPTRIEGVYVSGAYSGFGIMASCAGGDLLARHMLGKELPSYAPAFMLSRYDDPSYLARLATWGDGGQL
jgi:glycine/D-amino acid oxidase-like deaminating enzyme